MNVIDNNNTIREIVKEKIKANRREEITGSVLQGVLLDMIDAGEASQYFVDATAAFGYVGSFTGALAALIGGVRTSAVFVSFLTQEGRRELWQFNGGEFADAGNWQQFTAGMEALSEEEINSIFDRFNLLSNN